MCRDYPEISGLFGPKRSSIRPLRLRHQAVGLAVGREYERLVCRKECLVHVAHRSGTEK